MVKKSNQIYVFRLKNKILFAFLGDTDSLFVLFERKSKLEAFDLSYKIVEEITNMNVKPVKLKFEKIYYPSILLAKKRYVGYMYETPQQVEPVLDVKGN